MTAPRPHLPTAAQIGHTLASSEHLLSVVEQLAAKWRKHRTRASTVSSVPSLTRERSAAMAGAYCKSLAILLDLPYGAVLAALENGDL